MSEKDKHSGSAEYDAQAELTLAYLEGALDAEAAADFEALLSRDAVLSADLRLFQKFGATLETMGEAFKAQCPSVDVLDAVLGRINANTQSAQDNVVPFQMTDAIERKIEAELESIGEDFAKGVPAIDISASVLEKVRALEAKIENAKPDNVVPMRARPQIQQPAPQKQNARIPLSALLAAAATLLFVAAFFGRDYLTAPKTDNPVVAEKNTATENKSNEENKNPQTPDANAIKAVPKPIFSNDVEPEPADNNPNLGQSIYASITLDNVLNNKRNASMDTEEGLKALAQLKTWSMLTPEQARRLLESGELSMEALLGVAQFLPPAEAAALLEKQAALDPENPYLHFSLAAIYAGMGNGDGALAQLAALERNDPGNGMNPFFQASVRLDQGDGNMALALLRESAESGDINTYALESANFRADALMAQGFTPDVANYLASISAGTGEYNQILAMADDFINYGEEFEAAQDYNSALGIYQSLNEFGMNVANNAEFTNEQLAGLDTQNAALVAIQGIVEIFQDPASVQALESGFEVFNMGLQGMGDLISTFNTIVADATVTQISQYTTQIMEMGDIAFIRDMAQQ